MGSKGIKTWKSSWEGSADKENPAKVFSKFKGSFQTHNTQLIYTKKHATLKQQEVERVMT